MSKYKLTPLSIEQSKIVESVKNNNNVIVSSVAGSGKTTTSLHICSHLPNKKVLLLTYNSRLKIESRTKVKLLGLKNVEVHSYNAFCVKYYTEQGFRSQGLKDAINTNMKSRYPMAFDLIILDEQQDMTPVFYNFVCKILNDNMFKDIQICLFGDIYQNIYGYNGSDYRYLIYANKIFENNIIKRNWETLNISTSYRITNQIANFINVNMLKIDRLKATKNGPNVKYIITDNFKDKYVYNEIMKYLSMGYTPDDIFVLGASLKKTKKGSPICRLENKLVLNGIPCHAAPDGDTKIDDDIIKGKICFSSIHQVKGMERKICIVYNFDESYFNYYKKDADRTICPNELYVALTRACDRLILLHDHHNNYLPFIDPDILQNTCDIIEIHPYIGGSKPSSKPIILAVRDMVKNISDETLEHLFKYVKYNQIKPPNDQVINLTSKIKTINGLFEDVTDINGLVLPAIYEYNNTNSVSMLEQIMGSITNQTIDVTFSKLPKHHQTKIFNLDDTYKHGSKLTTNDIAYISIVYNSLVTGFIGKREQINNYEWLTNDNINDSLHIMSKYISPKAMYEQQIMHIVKNNIVVGIVDTIDYVNDIIFELKCTSELSKEHILQLVIYSYIYEKSIINITEMKNKKIMIEYVDLIETKKVAELVELCNNNNIDLFKIDPNTDKKSKKNKNELIMSLIDHKKKIVDSNSIKKMKYQLFNILSEEIIEIEYDDEYINIVEYLLTKNDENKISDDEFINNCLSNIMENNNDDNYMFVEDDDDNDGYLFV